MVEKKEKQLTLSDAIVAVQKDFSRAIDKSKGAVKGAKSLFVGDIKIKFTLGVKVEGDKLIISHDSTDKIEFDGVIKHDVKELPDGQE